MRQHARIMGLAPIADIIELPKLAALVWSLLSFSLVSLGSFPTVSSSGDGDRSLLRSGLLCSEVWSGIGSPIAELALEQLRQLIHTITEARMLSEQVGRVNFAMHLPELDGTRTDPLLPQKVWVWTCWSLPSPDQPQMPVAALLSVHTRMRTLIPR